MKRILFAGFGLIALAAQPTLAADRPIYKAPPVVDPIFNWTGFYVGVHLGYGWGRGDDNVTHLPTQAAFDASPFSASMRMSGWLAGVQAGYNWQSGSLVFGVMADISYADIHGNAFVAPLLLFGGGIDPGSSHRGSQKIDVFGTLRARLGVVAADRTLIFVSGGLAHGNVRFSSNTDYVGAAFQYVSTETRWKAGWTAGGGFEWAFSPGWSMLVEYLYYDLGRTNITANPLAPNPPFQVVNNWRTDGHIVRFGMNYRFGAM